MISGLPLPSPAAERFNFTPEFELLVLAAITHHPGFANTYHADLNPRFFAMKAHELWAMAAFDLTKKYGRAPSLVAVREAAGALCGAVHYEEMTPADMESVKLGIERAALTDLAFAVDKVRAFIWERKMLGLCISGRSLIQSDPEEFKRLMARANALGTGTAGAVVPARSYLGGLTTRIATRRNPNYDRYIPTGIARIDQMLFGGLRYGKMCAVLAPSRGGKSTFMMDCGAGALERGFKVLHITHEIKLDDLEDRYDTRLTGIPTPLLRENEGLVAQRLVEVARLGGDVRMYFFPRGSANAQTYRAKIIELREQGWNPDLLIADYPELWADPPNEKDARIKSGIKYGDFFTLCREFDLPGYCGKQTNRSSYMSKNNDLDVAAEDWSVVTTTDVAFVFGADEEMEQRGLVRIKKAKDRDRLDGQKEDMSYNKTLQRFE